MENWKLILIVWVNLKEKKPQERRKESSSFSTHFMQPFQYRGCIKHRVHSDSCLPVSLESCELLFSSLSKVKN